ncbi:hypothetical protein [Adhaeretor mobilis]|uniref:Uncharacterized protein n=1 Tax=Adhaeretor mobilis TaxID=1930276 RepID=A0A517MYK9_9BACT|nr:hypothetical protein [Adhaeretor mobilis]QDS99933.1 hypothetical protein HG15A2_32640 [Adhaeretor mobilis]
MQSELALQLLWLLVHALGLVAAWGVRASNGSRLETLGQVFFLFKLAVIALATLAGHVFCWPLWTVSAVTLGLMIVAVLVEFGGVERFATD